MNDANVRSKFWGVLPASIVAAGLIVSATIVSHKPEASGAAIAAAARPAPPIASDSAASQFKAQMMASPRCA
ncbi:MAG: hypothetical protein ABIY70_06870 [Capsulimonas sp.]|uniref:hypothetical protein n=1 Tax=Capsulimonas sp. TaxID=2494211 RepID=UPI00326703F6